MRGRQLIGAFRMDQILETGMHVRKILCARILRYIASSADDALLSHQSITCGQISRSSYFGDGSRMEGGGITDTPCGRTLTTQTDASFIL